jgi:hypothetical protein
VAELAAEVAGALTLLVGAVACHVALPPALEAAHRRRLKVLVKVPVQARTPHSIMTCLLQATHSHAHKDDEQLAKTCADRKRD